MRIWTSRPADEKVNRNDEAHLSQWFDVCQIQYEFNAGDLF